MTTIRFSATKPATASVVRLYKDGDAVITLEADGTQLAEVLKLMALPPDALLKLTVTVDG